jgi:hypothetical protein
MAIPVNFIALALIAATVAFYNWFLFFRQRGFGGMADRINLPHRRAALLMMLSFLAVVVWLFSGLSFAVLMVIPAWLWLFIEPSNEGGRKVINVVLALAGLVPFLFTLSTLPAGYTPWHVLLAASYGALWPIDILMFLLLFALFLRFLRLGLRAPFVEKTSLPSQSEIIERLLR